MAAPLVVKKWGKVPTYQRTYRAPTRTYPSASEASRGNYAPILEMIFLEETKIPSRYDLGYLLNCPTVGWKATKAENAVVEFVKKTLGNVDVRKREDMAFDPKVDRLAVSTEVRPDVSVISEGKTELIIEVDSNQNWKATIRKVLILLATMLASRNCRHPNDGENTIIGFYFPFHKKECVCEITVRWDDKFLRFLEERRYLDIDEVEGALLKGYDHNHQLMQEGQELGIVLNYPLSSRFLRLQNLEQLDSGQSIVLLDRRNRKIYKYPIFDREMVALYHLLLYRLSSQAHPTRIAYPIGISELGTHQDFVCFEMYEPPLEDVDAKECIVWFVDEAVKAIQELHGDGFAHLDIRRENFCIDDDSNQLRLIDLDRSQNAELPTKSVYELYGNDDMYTPEEPTWTLANLDWKQLGLMIRKIFAGSEFHDDSGFIQKLTKEGMYNIDNIVL